MRWIVLMLATGTLAAEVRLDRDVQPVLAAKCQACHQKRNASGGFAVDDAASLKKAAGGALLTAIEGDAPRMPKAGPKLTMAEVALIRAWVREGARIDGGTDSTWWALRPLPAAGPGSIDGFVMAALRKAGLTPSPEADRATLIRRLTFDLHGLPPSPEEVAAFAADRRPDAYDRLVTRLLESPRYGERWARHWMDVAHYGDTHGYDKDKPRPNAWPYRDWLIAALNSDMPYARFIQEQIAGDVLFPDEPAAVPATGFLAAGPWDFVGHQELREGSTDKNITRVLDRDDMVAQTVSAFTSMTAHCARCHDHKFDPISQADYYSLQAVFAGVDRADRPYDLDPALHRKREALRDEARQIQLKLQPLLDKVEFATSDEIVELDNRIRDGKLLMTHMGTPKTPAETEEKARLAARVEADTAKRKAAVDAIVGMDTYTAIDALKARRKALDDEIARSPKPQLVYTATQFFDRMGTFRPALEPRPVHVLGRGSVGAPGAVAPPGALACVNGLESRFRLPDDAGEGDRRAALAKWISHRDNVLTWRSIVNRAWHYHFGAGIVDTPSDFGRMGSQPSHPELLDWLAVWFRDEARGSLKSLHRLIVTSAAYRQQSAPRPEGLKADAGNRLLWRMNRQRLDAEAVHDSVLAAAGQLDLTMGGPGVQMFWFKNDHSPVYDYARFDPATPGANRRSIYRFIVRSVADPFFDRLDCPDPSVLAPKRSTTLTAIQAMALWNNPFMLRSAEQFAARLATHSADPAERLRLAGRILYGRELTPAEVAELSGYAAAHGWNNLARLLFNTNEFLFVD